MANVTLGGKLVKEEILTIDPDGSFRIEFSDISDENDAYSPYEVEVKVTDLTGETLSFFHRQYVLRRPRISLELENAADGSFRLAGEDYSAGKLLSDESARVSFGVSYSRRRRGVAVFDSCKVFSDEGRFCRPEG